MVWTKATFWLIANTLRPEIDRALNDDRALNHKTINALQTIAETFADAFAKSNDRFDREKFIKACGLEG